MDGYKHFAVTQLINGLDVVIDGYTSGFPEMTKEGAILILEDGPRSFYQQWGDIRNSNGQPIYKLVNGQMVERTADELFDFNEYKQAKIDLLSGICQSEILSDFTSNALGTLHTYGFDEIDQRNIQGIGLNLAIDTTLASADWKTRESVTLITHTRDQMVQVIKDAATHQKTPQYKYLNLKVQILDPVTDTKDKVDLINW